LRDSKGIPKMPKRIRNWDDSTALFFLVNE